MANLSQTTNRRRKGRKLLLVFSTGVSSGQSLFLAGRHDFLQRIRLSALMPLHRQGQIDVRFKPPYDKLIEIRNHLERLTLTQAWSLRETDLYSYQRQLDRIDESRVNGNFLDPEGNPADLHAQRVGLKYSACMDHANTGRHSYICFGGATHLSTHSSSLPNQYPRLYYPSSTNSKRSDGAYWKSSGQEAFPHHENSTHIA